MALIVSLVLLMFYELIRSIIQKVLQDKILLGLVVLCVLGLFVGGMMSSDEKGAKKEGAEQAAPATAEKPEQQNAAPPDKLTPALAEQFISWWLNGAMDYNGASAAQSHQQAMVWMTPDAANTFQGLYWNPQIAESVAAGRLVAAFQPSGVQAQAINPDGSVVVGVTGTMVVQTGAQPAVQQFNGSFLVRQEKEGLRVAGLDTHTGAGPGATIY